MNNEAFSDGFTLMLQTIANSQTTGAETELSLSQQQLEPCMTEAER